MVKKVLSVIVAVILALSMILCCTVIIKSALGYEKSIFGYQVFYIVSGSMEPTIPTGAAILVRKSEQYEINDIITFESSDSAIYGYPNTHRIIDAVEENGKTAFITKGDANPTADAYLVTEDTIYGKVVCHTGKMYGLGTLIGMITTPFGFLTVILLPILLIVAVLVRDFTKDYKAALAAEVEAMRNANGTDVPPCEAVPAVSEQTEVPIDQTPLEQAQEEDIEQPSSEQAEEVIAEEQPEEFSEAEEPETSEKDTVSEAEEPETSEKDTVSEAEEPETGEKDTVSEAEEPETSEKDDTESGSSEDADTENEN